MIRSHRRCCALGALLGLIVSLTPLLAPATAAPAPERVGAPTLLLTPLRPASGEPVVISGRVAPGRDVQLQARTGSGPWRVLARTVGTPSGSYRLTRTFTSTTRLRVLLPRGRGLRRVVSASRVVVVTPTSTPTPDPTLTPDTGPDPTPTPEPEPETVEDAAPPTWAVPAGIEQLSVDTGGVPVDSKDVYVSGTVTVDGSTRAMRIKGRGNTTWGMPKKPYKIKLSGSASLLGMAEEKDWVLLANHADPSFLRNWAALALGRRTRLAWNPTGRFVDLTLNGTALGSYLLVEAIEKSDHRVALPDDGLLLEVDERLVENGEPGYTTERGTPVVTKDPEAPSAELMEQLVGDLEAFEDALAEGGDWSSYVDTASFVDWYLVSELFKNLDGDFFSSAFVTWQPGRPFAMGPLWDFDLSSGYAPDTPYAEPTGWWVRGSGLAGATAGHPRHETHWLASLLDDPAFEQLVAARWRELSPVAAELAAQLPAAGAALSASATTDRVIWPVLPDGTVHGADHAAEVDYLTGWLTARIAWLDEQFA